MCCTSSVGTVCWQASSTAAGISDMYTLFTSSLPGLSSGRYVSMSFRMSFLDSTGLVLLLLLLLLLGTLLLWWWRWSCVLPGVSADEDEDEDVVWDNDEDDKQDTPDVDEQDEELVEERSKVELFFSESQLESEMVRLLLAMLVLLLLLWLWLWREAFVSPAPPPPTQHAEEEVVEEPVLVLVV